MKDNKKGRRKVHKDLKFLKNDNCAKAVKTFVKDQYNLNKAKDVKENYKLFSKLAIEGVDKFVHVKEPVKLFSKLAFEGVDEFVHVKEPVVRGKL